MGQYVLPNMFPGYFRVNWPFKVNTVYICGSAGWDELRSLSALSIQTSVLFFFWLKMLCHLVKWLRPAAVSALILKSDRIRHDNSVTRITYRLWGVSVDLGLGLPEVVTVWKREKTRKKKSFLNDKSENNPPTWLPAEMKKWNECCYYYLLHQWYIKHTSCRLTRRSWAHIPSLTDRKRHTDGEKSDAILKKKQSYQRDERHRRWRREALTSSLCGIPTCSSSWSAR